MNTGRIVQVVGPVVDIEFPPKSMPAILNAIKIDGTTDDGKVKIHLTCEVMQHIGYNVVRAVAMSSTDGLVRGMEAVDTVHQSVFRLVLVLWAAYLTYWVKLLTTTREKLMLPTTGLSIDRLRLSTNKLQQLKF